MENFDRCVDWNTGEFQEFHGEFIIGERCQERRMIFKFCDANHLCIANICFRKADNKNIIYGPGCNELDFCIMGRVDCKFLKNV